jgi:hypothetical protein
VVAAVVVEATKGLAIPTTAQDQCHKDPMAVEVVCQVEVVVDYWVVAVDQ